ncbi:MAG: indolepyruvate oxidoreductase subunit beta [Bacillota bacterium]|jgi:indolepyruvate ferredoxin oxidoreductase beta subunit|nr:indolepyruvate oxidoreductase subunit beta [Bacillota bacterium]HHU43492.1 indolepyruvate oxidoreductase subunit beta [Clostridiales bacterium]
MNTNILIVGVGGQGTLLASRILGSLAHMLDKECKLSEVHGMSQRGGSVVTHVRVGDKVLSPLVSEGETDFILAFEKLEALRWRHYLKKDGILIVNNQEIMPMPVITGEMKYPQDIFDILEKEGIRYEKINALDLAKQAGTTKAVNTVMLGVLAKLLGIDYDKIQKAVENTVKEKFIEVNKKALDLGYNN